MDSAGCPHIGAARSRHIHSGRRAAHLLRWLLAFVPAWATASPSAPQPQKHQQFDLFTMELPDFQGMVSSIFNTALVTLQRASLLRATPVVEKGATSAASLRPAHCASNSAEEEGDSVVQAWQNGTLGYAFSAGGFLFAYHCGVVNALRQWGLLDASTPLAGVSAGSLVAALVKCDVPTEDIQRMYFECVEDLRSNGTAGRMREVLRAAMERHLPADAHVRCSGSLHVGVSHLFPFPHHTQVSHFETREALVEALLTSCHLPKYSSDAWSVLFQGKRAVDGGFTAIVPTLPESANAHTVKVCCLPASRVARLPFLNKKQAMHNVAIIPDHPRHYRHSHTASSCAASSSDSGSEQPTQPSTPGCSTPSAAASPFRQSGSSRFAAEAAASTPQSPCPEPAHDNAASAMRRCRSASPFLTRAAAAQRAPSEDLTQAAEAATPVSATTPAQVSSASGSASPSFSSPSGLSRASSQGGSAAATQAGSPCSSAGGLRRLATTLTQHLSTLAKPSGAMQLQEGQQQQQQQEEVGSVGGDEGACVGSDHMHSVPVADHAGQDDMVREMVSWINVPAPDDDFYVRLMQRAERDTEMWVRSSGLAQHLCGSSHSPAPCASPRAASAFPGPHTPAAVEVTA